MKRHGTALFALAVCALLANAPLIRAQSATEDKAKAEPRAEKFTPLKVQVVWTEFDGDKKVKNLPYVFSVNAGSKDNYQFSKLRVGSKVPVHTGKDAALQYIDVGTNIDCRALQVDGGSFRLELVVERSWVESEVLVPMPKTSGDGSSDSGGQFKEPIIRQFRTEMGVALRDGQSTESTVATDPISGRVSKIEITLSVLK
jgi:hypothetical protein